MVMSIRCKLRIRVTLSRLVGPSLSCTLYINSQWGENLTCTALIPERGRNFAARTDETLCLKKHSLRLDTSTIRDVDCADELSFSERGTVA